MKRALSKRAPCEERRALHERRVRKGERRVIRAPLEEKIVPSKRSPREERRMPREG